MPDFYPDYIETRCETIGDNGSSEFNSNLNTLSSHRVDRNGETNIFARTIFSGIDFALIIFLLPFTACQKIYENDHLMVMLRVILEVSLELVMWLVLAGVSILTSAALIFDDLYCGKSGSENYRRLVKNCGSPSTDREDIRHAIVEERRGQENGGKNEWAKETLRGESPREIENRDTFFGVTSSALTSTTLKKKNTANGTEKSVKKEIEDEPSVNFSFYKPLHRPLGTIENRKFEKESLSQRF